MFDGKGVYSLTSTNAKSTSMYSSGLIPEILVLIIITYSAQQFCDLDYSQYTPCRLVYSYDHAKWAHL